MPQELHVLRCYSCQTFQVQIVKKVPKWQCKVCNEKQSVLKVSGHSSNFIVICAFILGLSLSLSQVYAKGSGKDCRQYVQDLNMQQGLLAAEHSSENTNDPQDGGTYPEEYQGHHEMSSSLRESTLNPRVSKWKNYLEDENEEGEEEEGVYDSDLKQYNLDLGQFNHPSRSKKRKINQCEGFTQPVEDFQPTSALLNSALPVNDSKKSAVRKSFDVEENSQAVTLLQSSKSRTSKWSQFIDSDQMTSSPLINCRDTQPFPNGGEKVSTSLKQAAALSQKTNETTSMAPHQITMQNKSTSVSKRPFCTLSDDDNLDALLDF
ncbi:hypothetical protein FOCC_FOCC014507 [Frankliniella occidentalis]|nr:hypothetical protein FOCC_FOCC014507 [Frankliniella occidentalis]